MTAAIPAEVANVEGRVRCRLGSQVLHFRLVVQDGGLILQGRARSYYAKQLAQHAAMDLTSLQIVSNDIEVTCG